MSWAKWFTRGLGAVLVYHALAKLAVPSEALRAVGVVLDPWMEDPGSVAAAVVRVVVGVECAVGVFALLGASRAAIAGVGVLLLTYAFFLSCYGLVGGWTLGCPCDPLLPSAPVWLGLVRNVVLSVGCVWAVRSL